MTGASLGTTFQVLNLFLAILGGVKQKFYYPWCKVADKYGYPHVRLKDYDSQ